MEINEIIKNYEVPKATQGGQEDLGKDAFLKLMLLQMKNQDPLNPMDNQAMLSQMAQFSSLEQMSNLNNTLSNNQALGSFMDSTRLLGREVEIVDPNAPADQPGSLKSVVKSISYTENGPRLTLENGMVAGVEELLSIKEPGQN